MKSKQKYSNVLLQRFNNLVWDLGSQSQMTRIVARLAFKAEFTDKYSKEQLDEMNKLTAKRESGNGHR